VRITTPNIFWYVGLELIAESELDVVTGITRLLGTVSFGFPYWQPSTLTTLLPISMMIDLSLLLLRSFLKTLRWISLSI
jgi:hypothetical protein